MTPRRLRRLGRNALSSLLMLSIASMALPPGLLPAWLPSAAPRPADAESLSSPRYVSAALMPNGQVGLVFENVNGSSVETRFIRYTTEHSLEPSIQLSTAGPAYPQLAVLGSTLVAAYVDTRSPNSGKLILRTSTDNGATWSSESNPFGTETFDTSTFAPRVVASHDGATLYVFKATSGYVPTYRSTTDLSSWTSSAAAGDSSMRVTSGNNCGSAGQECYRAHAFEFMETATSGSWVYIAKSDSGYGQSGRGTQVGSLGGSWSTQVDHGGSGGVSGGGESTATTFLGRDDSVYYIRADGYGQDLYFERSIDGGAHWDAQVHAYTTLPIYLTAAPVGLYVPGYSVGEFVWYAGFGGSEDTVRVVPLWSARQPLSDSGTVRLFGSAGGDYDAGAQWPHNFGDPVGSLGGGSYATGAQDLHLPGRLMDLNFARAYNSADTFSPGPFGLGWTHTYNWKVSENANLLTVRRGDGAEESFNRNQDGSYSPPPGVFDTLVRNSDGTVTMTTPHQVQYEFSRPNAALTPSKALGKTYTKSAAASGSYPDTGGVELNDGNLGSDASFSDATWQGHQNLGSTTLDVTVDLGSSTSINFARSYYFVDTSNGIYKPTSVEILTSTDNSTFTSRGSTAANAAANESGKRWRYELSFSSVSARYVRFKMTSGGEWLFPGEVQLYQPGAVLVVTEGQLQRIHEPAGNEILFSYAGKELTQITDTVGRHVDLTFSGMNYVAGRTYTKSTSPSGSYPDTGSSELTDGNLGTGNFQNDSWQGYSGLGSTPLDVTVDLGSAKALGVAKSYFYHDTNYDIYKPASVEILTSSDNSTYTSRGSSSTGISEGSGRWRFDVNVDVSARYVRFRITAGGTWLFPAEVAVGPQGLISSVSKASGHAYSKSLSPSSSYPDTGGTELTDGGLASATAYNDAGWQGYQSLGSTPLDVTVDLGSATSINTVRSYYLHEPGYAIYRPASVEVFTSTDNSTYTSRGTRLSADAANDAGDRWYYDSTFAPVIARYIRFRMTTGGDWLFPAEVQAFVPGAMLMDPAVGDRLLALDDPSGRLVTYSYDSLGRLVGVVDMLGNASGEDPDAHRWIYTYDGSSSHLVSAIDPDGRVVVTNTYDGYGRLDTQNDGLGKTTSFDYPSGQTEITDPRGHTTTLSYDSRNRVIQQDDPVGGTTYHQYFTYDDCGNQSSVTDRNGNRTDFTYDTACKGNLLEREEAELNPQTARFTTDWTYDSKNNVTQKTDAKGFVSTWTYDGISNVQLSATAPIDGSTSATTKWVYGDSSNPGLATRIVAPRGNTTGTPNNTYSTVLAYDSLGNLTSSTDADGSQTTYTYDSVGRRTTMVDPDGNAGGGTPSQHTWTTAYDALDRVTSSTDPLSHSTSSAYDGAGNQTSSTDKNGNVTTCTYDAAARLATVAQKPDPSGQPTLVYTTTVGRDDNGNATSMTQANSVVTNYAFDALNRLTSMTTHPAGGTNLATTYTLDGNGNTLTLTTADSVVSTYTYDNLSRLTQIAATGLASISYAYDELSRRTSMGDGTGNTTYSYDRTGRLTQAAQPNGTLAYAYDLDSNRTTLTYPGSNAVTYTLSNAGRLSSLQDWGSRTTSYTYTPAGLAATVTLPNGLVTTYTYDRAHRLTNLTNVVGSTTITSHAYTLDNEGNRTAQTEFVSGITTGASDSFGYTYDGLNRLTAVTTTNAESFTLDSASNIASRTGPSATFSYDTSGRLTSDGGQSFTWSNADRLTARGSDSFGYDPLDRLTSSTVSGTSRTYAYNGDGLLQSRTQGGSTTNLLWDPATSPSRLLQVGSDKIVYGLGPLYVVAGSSTSTLARDGEKSVRAEINSSGGVVASFRYRAYGQIAQSSGASTPTFLGYADQLLDSSGLYYVRARWYEPGAGRWISRDPVRGDPVHPASLNVYLYANANPAYFSDPTGLITGGLCISFAGQAGVRGSYTLCPLVVASNGDVGWTSTPGKGGGTSVAASATVGLQVSNANSVGCLGGPFISGGISAGEGIVVGADDFAGYCKSEGIIGGITAGAGGGVDLSPIALPVEVHAEATDTTTGVWFNLGNLFNPDRWFFQ